LNTQSLVFYLTFVEQDMKGSSFLWALPGQCEIK